MFKYAHDRTQSLDRHKRQIAHYTTADSAMKIIGGRSMWLRNAAVMNDHSEIEYGKAVMEPVLRHQLGDQLRAALDGAHPGVSAEVMERFEDVKRYAREAAFMTSLCEHEAGDRLGRLSMWRAYGGPVAGVCLLFNRSIVTAELSVELELSASPVLYGGVNEFHAEFESLVERLETNLALLKENSRQTVANAALAALKFAMLSIKHKGFEEEQEWRLLHLPYEYSSAHVASSVQTIRGIPQTVYAVPFHNPESSLFNIPELDMNLILEGIIIGPSLYPETVRRAFIDEMARQGIADAKNRVHVSDIPLRQWG